MKFTWSRPYCNMTYLTHFGAKRLPLHIHVSVRYFGDGQAKATFINLQKNEGQSNFGDPEHEYIGEYDVAKLKAEHWVKTFYGGN